MGVRTNALFLITLICGTILVVVLSIIISSGAKPKEVPRVMYFAMYLGDEDSGDDGEQSYRSFTTSEWKKCSFYLNVNNTRSSIMAMQNLSQQYSFILYDKNARSTEPLKALDAIARLTSIKPFPRRTFNQTLAVGEFARQSTERDKLVYYFPCRYKYSEDKDKEQFLGVIKEFGLHERMMLVSNTLSAEYVADAYNWSLSNIVGEGMNIVDRIRSFGSSAPSTTPSTYSTTTPALSTTTWEPAKRDSHCLFAGDLLNFGRDYAAYENEKNFIINIGKKLFHIAQNVSAGIWAYGYSNYSSVTIKNDTMRHSFEDFSKDVDAVMQLQQNIKIYNKRVLAELNSCNDTYRQANCLVFFSGVNSTLVWKYNYYDRYFKLNVTRNANITRVVAVSLKSVDFSEIVIPPEGIPVKVSQNYSDDESWEVVRAILKNTNKIMSYKHLFK